MDHYSIIHYLFQLFYRKCTDKSFGVYNRDKKKKKPFVFKPTEKELVTISNFIKLLDKHYGLDSIGLNFLITYFVFHFDSLNFRTGSSFKFKNSTVTIQFVVGKKAFQKWLDRDQNFDWSIKTSEFLFENNISLSQIKDFFQTENFVFLNKSEEIAKQLFFNTDRGFLYCIERTTLYTHKSKNCLTCSFKDDCKKLLKLNYPNIHKARGY